MHTLICNLLLIATLGAAPFPAPSASPMEEDLKFSTGQVVSVDVTASKAVIKTPAGPVTFDLSQAKLIGADKKPITLTALPAGQQVSIYFHIGHGAVAVEVDL